MYTKQGNRISLLPVSRYCGLAAQLSEAHGAGRAAAMSSAFHAQAAAASDAKAKLAQLTPKELEQIAGWTKPTSAVVDGQTLTYEDAAKEQAVGLTASGEWVDSGEVLTCGTLDFAWVVGGVAYVGDMKKSRWTTSGPDSLQLLTYGWAWAKKHGCHSFCVGLWIIEDAEWQWSPKVYSVVDFDSLDLWSAIAHAAGNHDGQASYGDHCGSCYGRLHCPEWVMPAAMADTVLGAVAQGGELSPERLAEAVAYVQRIKGVIERVEEQAKEACRRGVKVVHPETGKVWKPSPTKGRESLDQQALFAEMPEAKRFVKRGESFFTFRWSKP
jgi:hypothetical protein